MAEPGARRRAILPGTAPGATRRNAVVVLVYLVVLVFVVGLVLTAL